MHCTAPEDRTLPSEPHCLRPALIMLSINPSLIGMHCYGVANPVRIFLAEPLLTVGFIGVMG